MEGMHNDSPIPDSENPEANERPYFKPARLDVVRGRNSSTD